MRKKYTVRTKSGHIETVKADYYELHNNPEIVRFYIHKPDSSGVVKINEVATFWDLEYIKIDNSIGEPLHTK